MIIAAMPRSGKGDRTRWSVRRGRYTGGKGQTHRCRDLDPEEEEFAPGSSSLELAATASGFLEPPRRASPELTRFQVRPLLTMVMVPRWSVRRKGISFLRSREIVSECGWP